MARRRKLGRSGYTLIEVVVSLLLSAIMVGSVMSVALTAKTSSGKADRKTVAAQASRKLSGELKSFVTSYYDYNSASFLSGPQMGQIAGPATPGTPGSASWMWSAMPGYDGVSNVSDTCNGTPPCYALSVGQHTLSNYLPSWFEGAPYNGRATYTVTAAFGGGQLVTPQVSVSIDWTDP